MGLDVVKAVLALLPASLWMVVLLPVLLPVLLFAYVLDLLPDPAMLFIMMLILLLLSLAAIPILFVFWVPLRVDELTNASMVAAGGARLAAPPQARHRH
ncbi:MAG: hypothetical protein AB1801_01465, partial [Chloroflexota bacterium]